MSEPELSRPVRMDELGAGGRQMIVEADEGERAALAARFGLVAIDRLVGTVELVRAGQAVTLSGRLDADVTQSCVITDEPVAASVHEPLALRFEPEGGIAGDEIELGEQDLDVLAYEGSAIDVGEAIAQSLLLALDPFPRAPGADEKRREAGVLSEDEAKPLSPLAVALQAKLGKP